MSLPAIVPEEAETDGHQTMSMRSLFIERAGIDEEAFAVLRIRIAQRIRTHGPVVPSLMSWDKPLKAASMQRRIRQRDDAVNWAIMNLSDFPYNISDADLRALWFDYITVFAPEVFEWEGRDYDPDRAMRLAASSNHCVPGRIHSAGASALGSMTNARRRLLNRAGIDAVAFGELSCRLFERMKSHGPTAPTVDSWKRPYDTPAKVTRHHQRKALVHWALSNLSHFPYSASENESSTIWYEYITAAAVTQSVIEEQGADQAYSMATTTPAVVVASVPQITWVHPPVPPITREESEIVKISDIVRGTVRPQPLPPPTTKFKGGLVLRTKMKNSVTPVVG